VAKRTRKVVRASAFEVVDDDGRVWATLDCDNQGPGLRLWNHGNAVAVMAVGDDGAGYVVVAAADGTVLRSLDSAR
jgi:hypothetical protein